MGLLQKACETYDCFEHLAGKYEEGKEPLAPISHITTAAKIEITLDQEGKFLSARAVDKSETKIIIPVTEASAGRTSAPCPHPLCDQLCYLANYDSKKHQLYVEQLTEWNQSEYTHPKLNPILKYVQSNRILADLQNAGVIELDKNGKPKDEKALVRWRVNGLGIEKSGPCWADQSLMQAFIQFYANKKKKEEELFCMITGRQDMPAKQHIKGVVPIDGNAKLISANDESGFTYRGRFFQNWQAATISYTASQKAHNALRWIAVNEGVRMSMPGNELSTYVEQEQIHTIYGGRTFLCWSPQGVIIPHPAGAMSRKKKKRG